MKKYKVVIERTFWISANDDMAAEDAAILEKSFDGVAKFIAVEGANVSVEEKDIFPEWINANIKGV